MKNCLQAIRVGIIVCAITSLGLIHGQLFAQSGEKPMAKTMEAGSMAKEKAGSMAKKDGSAAKSMMTDSVGLEGFCPVCVVVGKGWVKGDPQIKTSYDGKTYYFPSAEVKQMFDAEPVKFTPALGGDCTVCLKSLGKRVAGDIHFTSMYKDRLFMFPNEEVKQKFAVAPEEYANIDLASNGDCTVCAIEVQKQVAGSPEFAVMHKGMRYLFPGADQMKMFVGNPTKYEVADPMMAK